MQDPAKTNRRQILKTGLVTSGTLLGVGTTLTSTVSGRGNVVSKVASDGHYAWFPLGPDSWGRSQNPVDKRQADARWLAEPAAGGGIRCRVENLSIPFRNAGFDIHLGSLGSIREVTVQSQTVTSEGGEPALLVGALYFDVNDNGEFFAWKNSRGNTETWDGFGGDTERGLVRPAAGSFTIDDDTQLPVFAKDPANPPRLGEIKGGEISGVDGTTDTALYLGVASPGGESAGTEEIVVQSVAVKRE